LYIEKLFYIKSLRDYDNFAYSIDINIYSLREFERT
jgi:hypothetical protein